MRDSLYAESTSIAAAQNIKERNYWLDKLSGELVKSTFPYDYTNRKGAEIEIDKVMFQFPHDVFARMMKLSNGSEIRMYIILVTSVIILLGEYTGNKDIIVGAPIYKQEIEGDFINTVLALRAVLDQNMTFKDLLLKVSQTVSEAAENQNYPIEKLLYHLNMEFTGKEFPLFDTVVLLENIHDRKYVQHIPSNVIFSFLRTDGNVEGVLEYNALLYEKSTIQGMVTYFNSLMQHVTSNINIKLSRVNLLTEKEKIQLLKNLNEEDSGYPKDTTIHGLFREQVDNTPDNIALIFSNTQITYNQLNERSNRLAKELRKRGVKPDTIVGLILPPSIHQWIGMIGILKAGGVYLPLDPDYPGHRLNFMLKDSAANIVLTTEDAAENTIPGLDIERIYLENNKIYQDEHIKMNLEIINDPLDLAYIIYTSGTTGRPKGVMIEHKNVVRLLFNDRFLFDFNSGDGWTMFHSFCFDFSVWEMYGALLYGGKLVGIPKMAARDPERYLEILKKHRVTVLNQTPSSFYNLIDEELKSSRKELKLRYIIFGGEALHPVKLKKWKARYPGVKLINMFGITETTVHVTFKEITDKEIESNSSNIGKPLPTLSAYVVDRDLNLLPPRLHGEICVGGEGVGRGYLNRPELSKEKFAENPYKTGERFYRSGDLVRGLQNGELEYCGRIDHQVQLRGYRIEPGEIENQLLRHADIKEGVVKVIENEKRNKYLCAYLVSGGEINVSRLREYLSNSLPDYMIPSYFVRLNQLPLTSNGKVDYKSLPDPKEICLQGDNQYVAPRNEIEKELVKIWQEVLGRKTAGVNHNFFEIGGDSIKSIQIASRMKKAGYRIEMRDIFRFPTISELAPRIRELKQTAAKVDQKPVTGESPLTPIQELFFQENQKEPHHFNQAVMFHSKEELKVETIDAIFRKIQEHHDALRMTFKVENGKIIQWNHDLNYPFSLQVFDFRNQENGTRALEQKANEIQGSIDLEKGPLMKLALFHLDDGDRLLIVIHHLVIDGVSWRILSEDIESLYQQYKKGQPLVLPLKSDSLKRWSEKLYQYANSKSFMKDNTYWGKLEKKSGGVLPIKKDFEVDDNRIEDVETISFALDEETTELLLTKANEAFATEINDILLTALGLAVKKSFGNDRFLIALEGHGREEMFDNMDINRTIGWFTSIYPVLMDFSYGGHLSRQIKEIKENLRKVPHNGIGYGILKYLTAEKYKIGIDFKLNPRISFNYLGQFDQDIQQMSFSVAKESVGYSQSRQQQRLFDIDVSGMVVNKQVVMSITYNRKQFNSTTVENLLKHYETGLTNIIRFCSNKKDKELTPSSLTYKELSVETLDRLMARYPLEDLYRLTPMQEGMLFHSLLEKTTSAYFDQISYRLHGELNIFYVEKSLNELFKRYDILRTIFIHESLDLPLQVVLKDRKVDFYYEDIRRMSLEDEKETFVREFKQKDRQRCFDLSKDVLMRVSVIQLDEAEYEFTWSFHHILMDGWCLAILNSQFIEIYNSLLEKKKINLPPVKPYRNYILWLEERDKEKSGTYWHTYLEGYEEISSVPGMSTFTRARDKEYKKKFLEFQLEKEEFRSLNRLAVKNNVTLNTFTQTIWGILLGIYNNKRDVVFGAVVSGRPSELEGVELLVGLFINTIPVRIQFKEKIRFSHLVREVQQDALNSEPHHYYPLADIQMGSKLKQDLLDHIFIFENYPIIDQIDGMMNRSGGTRKAPVFEVSKIEAFEQTNYDFNVLAVPEVQRDQLAIKFEYNSYVFDSETVERIADHFTSLVRQILNDGDMYVDQLTLLTPREKEEVLYQFNDTAVEYPAGKTIHELFELRVKECPDRAAAVFADKMLTYNQLNKRANQLARLLRKRGAAPGDIIGILAERSLEMVVGIMGILKSGGSYLPVSFEHPDARKKFMLEESGARLLLVRDSANKNILEDIHIEKIDIDPQVMDTIDSTDLNLPIYSTHLAYLIYTSGSTGKPKGVMVGHGNALNVLDWFGKQYHLEPGIHLLQMSDYTFDASVNQIFGTLLFGAALHLINKGLLKDIEGLRRYINLHQIHIIYFVPMLLKELLLFAGKLDSLRAVISGGEALSDGVKDAIIAKAYNLYNQYGPTETAVDAISAQCTHDRVTLGYPIANTKCYILAQDLRPLAVGVVGELYISGPGVAKGYINQPDLTREHFIKNPFVPAERMYRTGDLVRWLAEGSIDFIGRIDHQVKVRGFRLELGEIENLLLKHKKIKQAVVTAKKNKNQDKYICSYFVSEEKIETSELKDHLARELPEYMIPSYFMQLEAIPRLPSGKIDRNELPDIEPNTRKKYAGPRDEVEKKLVELWCEVLGIEKEVIGIDSDFFELGGHSLKVTILVSKIHKALDVKLPLSKIFEISTIRNLAKHIKGMMITNEYASITPVEKKDYYVLSSAQKRLFTIQQMNPDSTAYNSPITIKLEGDLNTGRFEGAIKMLIKRHENFRTSFIIIGNKARQRIHDDVAFAINYEEVKEENKAEKIIQNFVRPFDLSKAPLLRVELIKMGEASHILMLDMHHIISDGISAGIAMKDFMAFFGRKELPELTLQYKDFSEWQNNNRKAGEIKQQENYWLKVFEGEIPVLKLPGDYPRPQHRSFEGASVRFSIGEKEATALKEIMLEERTTLHILLLAIYNLLLAKISGQEDIVVGMAAAGRRHEDLQGIIGMFLNMLAIRNHPKPNKTFKEFLREVKARALEAYDNQDYQFEDLVGKVVVNRAVDRHPLFDTAFGLQNMELPEIKIPGLKLKPYRYEKRRSKVDLLLIAVEAGGNIDFVMEYNTQLFKVETIERFILYFKRLVASILENPHQPLKNMHITSEEEVHELMMIKSESQQAIQIDFDI